MILRRSGLRRRLGATSVCSGLDGGDVAVDGHGGDAGPGRACRRTRPRPHRRTQTEGDPQADRQGPTDVRRPPIHHGRIAQSCARGHTIEAPIPGDLRTSQKFQRHAPQTVGPISYPSRQSSAPIRGQTGARSSLALMAAQIILDPQICHSKKGELYHRYERGLENQLSALGLVLNCVVLWTTVYLDAAVRQLKAQGYPVLDEDMARLSPFVCTHLGVHLDHGTYGFVLPDLPALPDLPHLPAGAIRELRDPDATDEDDE